MRIITYAHQRQLLVCHQIETRWPWLKPRQWCFHEVEDDAGGVMVSVLPRMAVTWWYWPTAAVDSNAGIVTAVTHPELNEHGVRPGDLVLIGDGDEPDCDFSALVMLMGWDEAYGVLLDGFDGWITQGDFERACKQADATGAVIPYREEAAAKARVLANAMKLTDTAGVSLEQIEPDAVQPGDEQYVGWRMRMVRRWVGWFNRCGIRRIEERVERDKQWKPGKGPARDDL